MADRSVHTIDDAVQVEQRPFWMDRHDGKRELRLRSRERARWAASLIGILVAVSLVRWAWVSVDLAARDDLDRSWSWLAGVQFAVAVPGIVAGLVALAYLVFLVATGYVWRRWREVAAVFLALVLAWGVVYAIGLVAFRVGS